MNKCELVKDLIPLYVEGLTNESSNILIQEHLSGCTDCKEYYEMVKEDYHRNQNNIKAKMKQQDGQVETMIRKLKKYQKNIKLISVMVAMLMSCIIMGARVQFLSTIPFLLLTPFICRLFYNKSLPIILSSIPFGVVGGLISQENWSYIPFFIVVALTFTSVGVLGAIILKKGLNNKNLGFKVSYTLITVLILIIGSIISASFWGNPVGYINTAIKANKYVNDTYEKNTLIFKGIDYNFKDSQHYGKYEYILSGVRQQAWIGFYRNGEVADHYKFTLDSKFSEERSNDLKTYIAASINYIPINIIATPEEELNISIDEIDDNYYHLSFDENKRNKATAKRRIESGKLSYEISFGGFVDEYYTIPKDEFIDKSMAIFNSIKQRDACFMTIEIKAHDEQGNLQRMSFNEGTLEEEFRDNYTVIDESQIKKDELEIID